MKGAKIRLILIASILIIPLLVCAFFPNVAGAVPMCSTTTRADPEENAPNYIYIQINDPDRIILPAETASFMAILRNLGDNNLTYYPPKTEEFNLPTGWVLEFSPDTGIFIPGNDWRIMHINLTSPENADADTVLDLTIEGSTSIPDAEIINAELSVKVSRISDIQISTVSKITFDSPNEQENLEIAIKNNGNGDERVTLELTGIPEGLNLSSEAKEFIINPGVTEFFTITMFPSSSLIAGEYELNISLYRVEGKTEEWVSSRKVVVEIQYYPDLEISWDDIELSKYKPLRGEEVTINITMYNIGDSDAQNFTVSVTPKTKFGSLLESLDVVIQFLGYGKSTTISMPWKAEKPAVEFLHVKLDSDEMIIEHDESNNEAELHISIIDPGSNLENSDTVGEFSIFQVSAVAVIALIAGASVAMILSTEYGKYTLYKMALPFYTRVKKEEVLNHEVRELVYDYVQSHPGEHFRAILTQLGLKNGTLIHHLQTLERQNFIKSERDGPFKRFYPTGRNLTEDVLELNGIQKKIVDAVKTNPGITQKDLSMMLDTSPPTINYHVKALQLVRLLNLKRDGKTTRCYPGQSMNGWYSSGVA
jgi:predicted transcriptional regulator